jgi:hypothetical protein
MTAPTSTDVRARLVDTLRRDLIGPGPQDTDLTRVCRVASRCQKQVHILDSPAPPSSDGSRRASCMA